MMEQPLSIAMEAVFWGRVLLFYSLPPVSDRVYVLAVYLLGISVLDLGKILKRRLVKETELATYI